MFEKEKPDVVTIGTPDGKRSDNFRECIDRVDDATKAEFEEAFKTLNKGKKVKGHMKNFFECLEDRSEPMSNVDSHVSSMNALMTRKRREGFELA